jgi:hypothetical protein
MIDIRLKIVLVVTKPSRSRSVKLRSFLNKPDIKLPVTKNIRRAEKQEMNSASIGTLH